MLGKSLADLPAVGRAVIQVGVVIVNNEHPVEEFLETERQ